MAEIKASIVITVIVSLTLICIAMLFCKNYDTLIVSGIVGAIAMMGGVMIKRPEIDNNRGVLRW